MCHSRGSVSSLLSFSLLILYRGTSRNWSVLAFRFATLPSPPIPGYVTYTNVVRNIFMERFYLLIILTIISCTTPVKNGDNVTVDEQKTDFETFVSLFNTRL